MYRKALSFGSNNGSLLTGSFMTLEKFEKIYPLLFVFDLTRQENLNADLRLQFKYSLSNAPGEKYSWRALIVSEGEVKVNSIQGRATILMV